MPDLPRHRCCSVTKCPHDCAITLAIYSRRRYAAFIRSLASESSPSLSVQARHILFRNDPLSQLYFEGGDARRVFIGADGRLSLHPGHCRYDLKFSFRTARCTRRYRTRPAKYPVSVISTHRRTSPSWLPREPLDLFSRGVSDDDKLSLYH